MRKKTSSKYYGVIFRKSKSGTGGTWIAQMGNGRYRWYGGCFQNEKDAARAVVTEQVRIGIDIHPTLARIAVGRKIAAGISRAVEVADKADKSEIDRVTGLLRKEATIFEYENGYRLKCIDSSGGTAILNLTDPAEREPTAGIMLSAEVVTELIGWLTRLKSGRGKRDQSKE